MRYIAFGDKQASVLGFGCGSVMGRVGRRPSLRAMHQAWESGVTLFDTARSYGYGEAEGLLGEFLQGKRDEAVVITKFGIEAQRPAAWKRWAKPAVRLLLQSVPRARVALRKSLSKNLAPTPFDSSTMRRSLETSLSELGTDYVDGLLMHLPNDDQLQDETLLRAMEDVVQEGKVRLLGVSTGSSLLPASLSRQLQVIQFPINLLNVEEAETISASNAGKVVMANHCFAGPSHAAQNLRALARVRTDESTSIELREKLQGKLQQTLAEIVFGTAMDAGAGLVVASMLQREHIGTNVAAMERLPFAKGELEWLRGKIIAHA